MQWTLSWNNSIDGKMVVNSMGFCFLVDSPVAKIMAGCSIELHVPYSMVDILR